MENKKRDAERKWAQRAEWLIRQRYDGVADYLGHLEFEAECGHECQTEWQYYFRVNAASQSVYCYVDTDHAELSLVVVDGTEMPTKLCRQGKWVELIKEETLESLDPCR